MVFRKGSVLIKGRAPPSAAKYKEAKRMTTGFGNTEVNGDRDKKF